MGWATDLLDASFRGVPFECLSDKNKRDYILAISQSPFSNAAKIVPMGADVADINIFVIINGDDYKSQLDALLEALDVIGSGELIHPIYGIMNVYPLGREVSHSPELIDGCMVSISFKAAPVESTGAIFTPSPDAQLGLDTLVLEVPTARLQQLMDQLPFAGDLSALSELSNNIGNAVAQVHRAIGVVTTTIDDFTNPPDWIAGLLADVTGLTDGFLPGAGALAAWRAIASKIGSIDESFSALFSSGSGSASPAMPEPLQQVSRTLAVGGMIAAAQAVIVGEFDTPTLTPPELARIRDDVRIAIQTAINAERAVAAAIRASGVLPSSTPHSVPLQTVVQVTALKQAAASIQSQFQALIERRPPFTTRLVPLLCCSRWLAHRLYADHTRATELVRLNPQIANSALLYAGMAVHAYAQ
jgi:prophage DNA circulation protein